MIIRKITIVDKRLVQSDKRVCSARMPDTALGRVSVVAVLVAAVAMWWRLRRHLRQSNEALKNALREIEPEHESIEQR